MLANVILFLALLLTGLHLVTCLIVMWRLQRPAPRAATRPFITLLRPVCGLDRFDAETLASSFAIDWPAYEVIFCAAHADDPAVPLVRDLIAGHRHVPARLLDRGRPADRQPEAEQSGQGLGACQGRADRDGRREPDAAPRLFRPADRGRGRGYRARLIACHRDCARGAVGRFGMRLSEWKSGPSSAVCRRDRPRFRAGQDIDVAAPGVGARGRSFGSGPQHGRGCGIDQGGAGVGAARAPQPCALCAAGGSAQPACRLVAAGALVEGAARWLPRPVPA